MQTAAFQVIDVGTCRATLGVREDVISRSHFCTENTARMCFGYLGSGLVMQRANGEKLLVGVASVITNMCHDEYPVMFTEVDKYKEWIREQIAEEEIED